VSNLPMRTEPTPHVFREKIGDGEWLLEEKSFDVMDDVLLWDENPRLRAVLTTDDVPSQLVLEQKLQATKGYDTLKKSIADIGQLDPIYVWRSPEGDKYLVLEGATRVTILRDLHRKSVGTKKEGRYLRVKAKVLPPHFGKLERAVLLARIHVRGSNVRGWGRFLEAQFIYDTVQGDGVEPPVMTATELSQHMGKSLSWVTRLRDAYTFGRKFVDHVDDENSEDGGTAMALKYFSILEEISRAPKVGPLLKDYDNSEFDTLRAEVFDMVRNDAFSEYRDARFMKEFYDDPDKWAQLKSGEPHIAKKLALEVKTNSNSMKARIAGLEKQVQRAVERAGGELDEEDAQIFQRCAQLIEDQVHAGVPAFQLRIRQIANMLKQTSLADVSTLTTGDLEEYEKAVKYFETILSLRKAT